MSENLTFAYPWIFFLLPMLLLLPYLRRRTHFQAIPASEVSVRTHAKSARLMARSCLQPVLHFAFLVTLLISAARPQEVTSLSLGEDERRNIMLALDASKSMDAKDFRSPVGIVRRLDGVKSVTANFIQERKGDRIGLVLFGSKAFLQAPLTIDHGLLHSLVSDLRVGVAGDGTAIGDGLGIALKRIEELPARARAVILITDGVSNSGRVEPLEAARIAKELGVKVYTIGIGSPSGSFVQIRQGIFAPRRIRAEFDEKTMREIARITEGKYFFASDANELDQIYREIDLLEKTNEEEFQFQQTAELAAPFLLASLFFFVFHFILSQTVFRVVP